jgi:hypothetical protein
MKRTQLLIALIVTLLMHALAAAQQPAAVVELPMKFRGPMPAVEVMVNGKGPFLFAIDTGGSGDARLDAGLVKTLGLEPVGEAGASDGSGGGNVRVIPVYQAASIKVGSLEFKNVQAPSRDYNIRPDLPRIDGILGFGLFKDHLLTLDYPGKKVRISKGSLAKADNVISFEAPRGIPTVELGVGNEKLKAHIDSGNTVAPFILPADVVDKLEKASEPVVVGTARTVSNEVQIKQVRIKDTITLGPFKYDSPTINFPAFGPANIGSKALSEYRVTFDQVNHLVKLERVAPAASSPGRSL